MQLLTGLWLPEMPCMDEKKVTDNAPSLQTPAVGTPARAFIHPDALKNVVPILATMSAFLALQTLVCQGRFRTGWESVSRKLLALVSIFQLRSIHPAYHIPVRPCTLLCFLPRVCQDVQQANE